MVTFLFFAVAFTVMLAASAAFKALPEAKQDKILAFFNFD